MTQEEISQLNKNELYSLELNSGLRVFPAKWDNDQEHFYCYIDEKEYEKEHAAWEASNDLGPGMPGSAEEAEQMARGLHSLGIFCRPEPKPYRIYKVNQVRKARTVL